MVRTRLVRLGMIASLAVVSGCTCLSQHPWFARLRGGCASSGCDMGGTVCDGPILDGSGQILLPPGGRGELFTPPLSPTPQGAIPSLTPAPQPRLVPQPQSQPIPYTPP